MVSEHTVLCFRRLTSFCNVGSSVDYDVNKTANSTSAIEYIDLLSIWLNDVTSIDV